MVEIENPVDTRERWDGHDLDGDDGCPIRPLQIPSQSSEDAMRVRGMVVVRKQPKVPSELIQWQNREQSRALARLGAFLDSTDQADRVGVVGRNETFRLSDWPKGTIVRYNADLKKRNSEEDKFVRIGIIWQARTSVGSLADILIALPGETMSSMVMPSRPLVGLDPAVASRDQATVVGTVGHIRYSGQASEYDVLYRYNSIEVLQLGTDPREVFQPISRHSPRKQNKRR